MGKSNCLNVKKSLFNCTSFLCCFFLFLKIKWAINARKGLEVPGHINKTQNVPCPCTCNKFLLIQKQKKRDKLPSLDLSDYPMISKEKATLFIIIIEEELTV